MTFTATVQDGRVVVDVGGTYADGATVTVLVVAEDGVTAAEVEAIARAREADPGDEMDDAERAALEAVLDESDADVAAGRVFDAADVLAALRAQ